MMFKRIIFLLALFGPTVSSSLEVFSDILLNHDAMYTTIEEPTVPHVCSGKFRGKARLSLLFLNTLQEKVGISSVVGDTPPIINLTTMTESSTRHVDCYLSGRQERPEHVGFVFLNTNPDAHFVHGESTVPIVEGRMVLFDGGIPHNTIVNSGSVKLLGPFDAKDFTAVGIFKEIEVGTKSRKGPKSSKKTAPKKKSDAVGDQSLGGMFDGMLLGLESLSMSMSFSNDEE